MIYETLTSELEEDNTESTDETPKTEGEGGTEEKDDDNESSL
jgi:hypothetical protein